MSNEIGQNPYSEFLEELEKPARYIGGEKFQVVKDWDKTIGKMALCFPDTYEIGMSHLGMKILYDEVNKHPSLLAERCFCPWVDAEKQMRERDLKLVSLETFTELSQFDVLGFSLQYEMSYTNILNMMDLGGVPVWQKDRGEKDPFVVVGGPCATHPEPLANFVDMVVVGDGEDLVVRLVHFIGEARKKGLCRTGILEEVATWQGIYVPSLYETEICDKTGLEYVKPKAQYLGKIRARVERFFVENLKDYPFPTESPVPHMTAIFDRFSVELARGCTEGCRFCQAGMIYRPVRERRPENVIESVMEGMKKGGFQEASLTCLSTADYSAITPLILDLLDKMGEENAKLGISSLRAYGLDKKVLDKLAEVKNSSLTFAPEAGSERMRKVINKNVSAEDLDQTAKNIFERGWQKMKLYFMIGLPTETDEDVAEIMENGLRARKIAFSAGVKNPTVTVSVSSFVPKPHTPFQWAKMITLEDIERKQEMLFLLSKKYKLNFRKHVSKISFLEGIVSRGDRRVGDLIHLAWSRGARFDGWNETFKYDLWIDCLNELGIDPEIYVGTIRMDGRLPWDHINVGLEDRFLEKEWIRATKDRLSPPCGKPNKEKVHYASLEALERAHDEQKKRLVCYNCGVACDLTGMVEERREFLTELGAVKDEEYIAPADLGVPIVKKRENRGQNVGYTYRVQFSKLGPLSFISHLDLQKVMVRIFKRAGFEMLFSEGYNRRPLLSFGTALPLGINSLKEYFDVRVPAPWGDFEDVLQRLREASEKGILLHRIEEIDRKTPSLQSSATFFEYFYPVSSGDPKQLVAALDKSQELTVSSFSKKKKKNITRDLRPRIADITAYSLEVEKDSEELLKEVHPKAFQEGIKVKTHVEGGSSIRPLELKEVIEKLGFNVEKPVKVGFEYSDAT